MQTFNRTRRHLIVGTSALAATGLAPFVRAQGGFPNRPVKLYVGASAGGAPDAVARSLSNLLGPKWGQPIVVENRPGVAGLLAAESASRAAPDGHELALVLDSPIVSLPFMLAKMSMDPMQDLRPVALMASFPLSLIAHPSVPYRDLRGMVAAAKAAPGKVDYASSGVGSSGHLAMETLQTAAGIKMNHLPYKGGIPALNDVVAGHVPLLWGSVTACAPQVRAGKVVALAVGSRERAPLLAEVPTAIEQGFTNYTAGNWLAVFGSAKMPDELVRRLHADFTALGQDESFRKTLVSLGIEPRSAGIAEFQKMVQADYARNKELFPRLGIKRE